MGIKEKRDEIDEIDIQIVKLLAKRMEIVKEIGKEKLKNGIELRDKDREAEIIRRVKETGRNYGIEELVERVYQDILYFSRQEQRDIKPYLKGKVVVLGPEGSYTEEAALNIFSDPVIIYAPDIYSVFKSVEKGADYGVVPIENSIEGSISATIDFLSKFNVKICGEIIIPIEHVYATANKEPKKLFSHQQAISQCRSFIDSVDIEIIPVGSTAIGAKLAKRFKEATICSERAAKIYGLKVIKKVGGEGNYTRFFVISERDSKRTGEDKSAIIVYFERDEPGILYKLLEEFAERNINLTKIESRPIPISEGHFFFIEFEGHRSDEVVADCITSLKKMADGVKILGSYKRWKYI